jgi:serine/threonine protein kinase
MDSIACIQTLDGKVLGNLQHNDPLREKEQLVISKLLAGQSPPIVRLTKQGATFAFVKRVRDTSLELTKLDFLLKHTDPSLHRHLVSIRQTFKVGPYQYMVLDAARGIGVKRAANDGVIDRIVSFEQLTQKKYLTAISFDMILGILLQLVCILVLLQERIPGFAHNDLKLDNILFSPLLENEVVEFPSLGVRIPSCPVRVVLIDMETVIGKGIEDGSTQFSTALKNEFGFGSHLPYCEYTDFHLVLLLLTYQVQVAEPVWTNEYNELLTDWKLQDGNTLFYQTHQAGNRAVTKMNRLTAEARDHLQRAIENKTCPPLRALLWHPVLSRVLDVNYQLTRR